MSLKIHFLYSHLSFFPENLGAVSDKQGERFIRVCSSQNGATVSGKMGSSYEWRLLLVCLWGR
jgi:hypothetical protein